MFLYEVLKDCSGYFNQLHYWFNQLILLKSISSHGMIFNMLKQVFNRLKFPKSLEGFLSIYFNLLK